MDKTEKKIKMLLASADKTQQEAAAALNYSPQAFGQKLKRGTLKPEDMEKIAEFCGAHFIYGFRLKDGTEI